ncbi:helix-turn-helix transcriptional regulator [Pigmentiphaga aceris]|uniref:Helix-turn-helix transcriptional regulator n=1 Tax=Pigmentiphaga aceris TaxID=1940612 RepID=A0A5C0AVD3_9BURK|nr:helix-turn-helix transcriptional regulator [Pigmentiphaga aceris]QEI05666.1 helix-turn-helix transcriptional regulator [Pigmentiphaga aceris]
MSNRPSQPSVFCLRLKAARMAAGMSQRQLGVAIGLDEFVASTRINRYELGVHQADIATAERLAGALGVPLAYFYAHDDRLAHLIAAFPLLPMADQEELLARLSPRG